MRSPSTRDPLSMTDLLIRPGRAADLAAICEITRDSFAGLAKGHYAPAQVAAWMQGCSPETYREGVQAGRIRVADLGNEVVGYVDAGPGEITRLFVLPKAAGRGIGSRLLRIGVRLAREGHEGAVVLESLLNAVSFYEQRGFVATGKGFSSHGSAETPPIEIVRMSLPA
ncbi:MAG: GNAT family N-acetyltransferase [Kiloniellales bacterium]|nr:GNAT family N-acetyltransferase [Kiloniellales bacterium]